MAEKTPQKKRRKRPQIGPLIPYLEDFRCQMVKQQYSSDTISYNMRFLLDFSQWLGERRLDIGDLNDELAAECYWQLRRMSQSVPGNLKTLLDFIAHLRDEGVVLRIPAMADGGSGHDGQ